jgi:hypothetical protein
LVFSRDEGILGPVPAAPPLIKPKSVRLEVSSRCQLRCPSCPTTTKAIEPAVGSGVLKFDDFKNFLQANPSVRNIEISNYGEVFLNPEILKILQRAHEKRVTIKIENGANLNHVSDEVLEALVKFLFIGAKLTFSGIQGWFVIFCVPIFEQLEKNLFLIASGLKFDHTAVFPEEMAACREMIKFTVDISQLASVPITHRHAPQNIIALKNPGIRHNAGWLQIGRL